MADKDSVTRWIDRLARGFFRLLKDSISIAAPLLVAIAATGCVICHAPDVSTPHQLTDAQSATLEEIEEPSPLAETENNGTLPESESSAKSGDSEEDTGDAGELDEFAEFDEFEEDEDVAQDEEVFDPVSGLNRGIYHFNDKFYCWVWRPTAKGYRFVVPEVARIAIDHAYKNLRTPPRFGNALLQLKFEKAGIEIGRLVVNSTIGIGGLFDAAEYLFDLRAPSPEDFGQTLGRYGVGGSFPIVLPFLGPSNVRDGLGMIPDSFSHPVVYFIPGWVTLAMAAGDYFNHSSLHIGEYASFKKDALDPYTFFRDLYQQNREKNIQE